MNLSFFEKSFPTIIKIGVLFVILIFIGFLLLTPKEKLPIYSPSDINPRLVDHSIKHVRSNHKIADFKLVNQNGDTISHEAYAEKIYVADFFFTRCQTICPIMTTNMAELQDYFKNDSTVLFLSHSVTPVIDSISVLKDYAQKKGVIDGKWHLVTGEKKQIYELARKSYFAALEEGDGGDQDFIHTEQFVLVDKKRQIRGMYDGTDTEEIAQIINDIEVLKKEYNK